MVFFVKKTKISARILDKSAEYRKSLSEKNGKAFRFYVRLILEQRGGEITLRGIGQDGDNALAGAELFGKLDGRRHIGA